jgi:chromodomain-helicase-DNA-binding protein 1
VKSTADSEVSSPSQTEHPTEATVDTFPTILSSDPVDSAASDNETHLPYADMQSGTDEPASSPESKHEADQAHETENSSGDDGEVCSEDGDYDVEEYLQEEEEEYEEEGVNGYSSTSKSDKADKVSKEKVVNEFYDNPDLYGLRRSERARPHTRPMVCCWFDCYLFLAY